MRRLLSATILIGSLALAVSPETASPAPAAAPRPAPFPGVSGRWLKLPGGAAFRPDVPAGWEPYSKGRFQASPAGPLWQGEAEWETTAAKSGTWSRVATWGWVFWPSAAPSRRPARVLFAIVAGPRPGVVWAPLGPKDDESWIARLESRGAKIGNLPLQNGTAFRFVAREHWPHGGSEKLKKRPPRATLVAPAELGRSLGSIS